MTIFKEIKHEIITDKMNSSYTNKGIEPLFRATENARIAIVGQANVI